MKSRKNAVAIFWSIGLGALAILTYDMAIVGAEVLETTSNRTSLPLSDFWFLVFGLALCVGSLLVACILFSLIFGSLREPLGSVRRFVRHMVVSTVFFFFVIVVFIAIQFILDWLPLQLWRGLNAAFCEGDTRCMPGWIGDHFWWKCFLIALIPYAAWVVWSARLTIASPQRPARSKTTKRIGLVFVALVSLSPVCGFIALSYEMGDPPPGPAMPPDIPRFIDRIETI